MLETLAYAATALIIVVVLVKVTPSGTSIVVLGMLVIGNLAVLAAAYAQANRPADVERTVALLRSRDPTFDALTFGNKFRDHRDLERLR